MQTPREAHRVGLGYLEAVTTLLQRIRGAHPTAGLYEAADLQWWWRDPRPTDEHPQLFWFDDADRPVAAVILTDWGDRVALDPFLLPGATPDWVALVVERGLAHANELGFGTVGLEVASADGVLHDLLAGHGFTVDEDCVVETWLAAAARPAVSSLGEGYRLSSRLETATGPHHMVSSKRNHADVEQRLRQTSLYRPDLDLVIHDRDGTTAAYGLFWFDPVTSTGLVEPMRTEDDHQGRGLARHILTSGLDRLATVGAERIKICFEPGNEPARHLYLSAGFQPDRETVLLSGPTGPALTDDDSAGVAGSSRTTSYPPTPTDPRPLPPS